MSGAAARDGLLALPLPKIYGDNLADKIITHVAYIIQHGENILVWNDVLYEFFFVGWGSSASFLLISHSLDNNNDNEP